MREIRVAVPGRPYVVHIERGIAGALGPLLEPFGRSRLAVVSSPTVWQAHGPRVVPGLAGLSWTEVLVPDGERQKTARTLQLLYDAFVTARLGRDSLVLAVGGGVIGDMAGFAAATYMRGVDWVGVPTTLLAMVDSSIGGKVGINHPRAKNMIGAFHQPRAVIVDPAFLATLPARQRQSGAYEVLKCGIIGDRGLFEALRQAPPSLEGWNAEALDEAIAAACRLKAERRETGRARGRPAPRAEPGPHAGARARGGHGLSPLHARRGRGLGPDGGRLARAPPRPALRRRLRRRRGRGGRPRAASEPGPPRAGARARRGGARQEGARTAGCRSSCPPPSAPSTIVPDVTTGEILAVLDELVSAGSRRAGAAERAPREVRPGG